MGIGIRLYIVEDDDSLKRIPFNRYERMLRGVPGEALPQYSGRRMRSICAAIDMINRKPAEILRLEFSYLAFDSEGKLDRSEFENAVIGDFEHPVTAVQERHGLQITAQGGPVSVFDTIRTVG